MPLLKRNERIKPRRTIIYGGDGVGKSTWACSAPSAAVIDIEDGLGNIEVDATPVCRTLDDVQAEIGDILTNDGGAHQTVVIDSIDWLERLIWKKVEDCIYNETGERQYVPEIPFNRGYMSALPYWDTMIRGFEKLRELGKHVVLIAHADIVSFTPPDGEQYQRYDIAVHKTARAVLREWADEVFFLRHRPITREASQKSFGQTRTVAVDAQQDRYIQTAETTAAAAKNRLGLPIELSVDWAAYQAAIDNQGE